MNVRNKLTKEPKNLFFTDRKRKSNNRKMYNIKNLLYTVVRFETPYKKQVIVYVNDANTMGTYEMKCAQFVVECTGAHDCDYAKKRMKTKSG